MITKLKKKEKSKGAVVGETTDTKIGAPRGIRDAASVSILEVCQARRMGNSVIDTPIESASAGARDLILGRQEIPTAVSAQVRWTANMEKSTVTLLCQGHFVD